MKITAGYGDPETWGPCEGHPNDPRFYDEDEESERIEEELRRYEQDMDEKFGKGWK